MPNYQYKCRDCETVFDVNHSIHDEAEDLGLMCENCESENIFRYLGNYDTATIVFRGMGWAGTESALDKIGMPKATRNSPEAQQKLKDL